MTIRVAINGYGRNGRNILRAHYEGGKHHNIQIVAINDLGSVQTNAHLTQYDTTHGRFPGTIAVDGDSLLVNGDAIKVCAERDPKKLPWEALNIDVVLNAPDYFTSKEKSQCAFASRGQESDYSAPGGEDGGCHHRLWRQSSNAETQR